MHINNIPAANPNNLWGNQRETYDDDDNNDDDDDYDYDVDAADDWNAHSDDHHEDDLRPH